MTVHIFEDSFIPLPVYFVTASARHEQENIRRMSGLQDISQLLFVLDGSGTLYYDGREYPLQRGTAFYVDKNTAHSYENISGLVTAWITWRGDGFENIRDYIGRVPFVYTDSADVKRYVHDIEKLEGEYFSQKREGLMSHMLYGIIISFFEERRESEPSDMEMVMRYMEEHFGERLTVSELSALCYSSVSTFCKKFRQTYGCTAFEKLTEIRLLNARTMLLSDPDEKIKSIAKKCGFDDVSYFCKAYKKKFSLTPTEEREH